MVRGDSSDGTRPGGSDGTRPGGALPVGEPAVVTAFWKGIDVFRPLALAYAVYSLLDRREELVRPLLAWGVLAVLALWTVLLLVVRRRSQGLVVAELVLAAAAVLATRLVDSHEVIVSGSRTLPAFWPAAGVVSAAVVAGWRGGLLAGLFIGVVDIVEVRSATPNTVNNVVLLLLIGGLVGYAVDLAREGHARLREALVVEARLRERDRLARTVHDGVLQALAFIHRRGEQLGGEASRLGALAAEQERSLRALVTSALVTGAPEGEGHDGGEADLQALLAGLGTDRVHVAGPAGPVVVAGSVATEVLAAVGAALHNVHQHAGQGAQAWVLLEDRGADVAVTVRDDGCGMPAGRLEEAAAAGRMGASSSIVRRVADLGGTAEIVGREGSGVTVRLVVPRSGTTGRGRT